jgi:hypothetical protein
MTASPTHTQLAAELCTVMDGLLEILERETELVRAGRLSETAGLEAGKADLAQKYLAAIGQLKAIKAKPRRNCSKTCAGATTCSARC